MAEALSRVCEGVQFARSRAAFPEMKGFSSRNHKYMPAFSEGGRVPNLCSRLLHNCLGFISTSCQTSSGPGKAGIGGNYVWAIVPTCDKKTQLNANILFDPLPEDVVIK